MSNRELLNCLDVSESLNTEYLVECSNVNEKCIGEELVEFTNVLEILFCCKEPVRYVISCGICSKVLVECLYASKVLDCKRFVDCTDSNDGESFEDLVDFKYFTGGFDGYNVEMFIETIDFMEVLSFEWFVKCTGVRERVCVVFCSFC